MGRRPNDRVWFQDSVIFQGGDERRLLTEVDGDEIFNEIIKNRLDKNLVVGDSTIIKEVKGVKLKFTQKQTRSKRIYVEKVNE